jgi:hypothetical protein
MFGWLKRKMQKSYAEVKRELEVRDELYSGMSSLSDNQMEKWVETRVRLKTLRQSNGVVHVISPRSDK